MMKIRKLLKNKKGFTMIELVCVVVIIGILGLFSIPKYQTIMEDVRIKHDINLCETLADYAYIWSGIT